jgi:hypothetical protein
MSTCSGAGPLKLKRGGPASSRGRLADAPIRRWGARCAPRCVGFELCGYVQLANDPQPAQPCAGAPPRQASSPRAPGPAWHAPWPGQRATHPARRCLRALARPPARPGQPPRPTRRPAPGACGSAPAPARRARAGHAYSGQARPSWEPGYPPTRDRSTSQLPDPAMAATPRAIIPLPSRPADPVPARGGPDRRRRPRPDGVGDASLSHSPRLDLHSTRVQRYPAVRSGPRSFRPAGDPADSGWRGEHLQG